MKLSKKYGSEFFYAMRTLSKADGSAHPFHDVGVCIKPKTDAASTLADAWNTLRELAQWVCEEFKDNPQNETYRIVVAWSKSVRPRQGHILKVWVDLAGVREIVAMSSPEQCAARFGSGWMPFYGWQKDVFTTQLRHYHDKGI
jgi:hypothetical protein